MVLFLHSDPARTRERFQNLAAINGAQSRVSLPPKKRGVALIGGRHGVDMCHSDLDATRKAYAAL